MLPRKYRLTESSQIKRVLSRGKRFSTPHFVFHALESKEKIICAAFVVSNKVGKRASTRNLLKRRMRAAMKSILLKVDFGVDVVVISRNNAVNYVSKKVRGKRTPFGRALDFKTINNEFIQFFSWLMS